MKRAFSLIELLVALSILAIVAALIVPKLTGIQGSIAQSAISADKSTLQTALAQWMDSGGTVYTSYPYGNTSPYPNWNNTALGSILALMTLPPSQRGNTAVIYGDEVGYTTPSCTELTPYPFTNYPTTSMGDNGATNGSPKQLNLGGGQWATAVDSNASQMVGLNMPFLYLNNTQSNAVNAAGSTPFPATSAMGVLSNSFFITNPSHCLYFVDNTSQVHMINISGSGKITFDGQ